MKITHSARSTARAGFSLIELVVVVLIMAVLAGVVVPRVVDHQRTARDSRRLADIKTIRNAVEQYYLDNGQYPPADGGGWNDSTEPTFIRSLVEEGYLTEMPSDPINDNTYYYRYRVYNKGAQGCVGSTRFFVLGIRRFETEDYKTEHPGFFKCANKDWAQVFDYVTGGGASFR